MKVRLMFIGLVLTLALPGAGCAKKEDARPPTETLREAPAPEVEEEAKDREERVAPVEEPPAEDTPAPEPEPAKRDVDGEAPPKAHDDATDLAPPSLGDFDGAGAPKAPAIERDTEGDSEVRRPAKLRRSKAKKKSSEPARSKGGSMDVLLEAVDEADAGEVEDTPGVKAKAIPEL